jgi:hypothetical protein
MRLEFKRRINKFYRCYRAWKFGEPLVVTDFDEG